MIQILLLSPSSNLTERVQKVISERGLNFTVDTQTISVEDVDDAVEKAVKDGIKIIMSRGGMAYILRKRFNIPVVEIKQSTSSYVEVLEKLKNTQGPVAFSLYRIYRIRLRRFVHWLTSMRATIDLAVMNLLSQPS